MLAAAAAAAATMLAGCPVFPASNAWNTDISHAPLHPRSEQFVRSIGLGGHLHPDFASRRYGLPITIVPASQPRVPIDFTDYGDESDPGPYPIPLGAAIENGSDRHVLVLQRGSCRLFELYDAHRGPGRRWRASSGARFDLRSNRLRPAGWTSADAAGLPILPGLARADEVRRGRITHALRMTVSRTQKAYISPARHFASSSTDPTLPPMGLRLRLKAGYSLRGFHGQARVVLVALKRYGLIVADNGSDWYITGTRDPRWNDDDLHQLARVSGSAFEAVDTGPTVR